MKRLWPKGYYRWDLKKDVGRKEYDYYTDTWSYYRLNVCLWVNVIFWLPYSIVFWFYEDGWFKWIFAILTVVWLYLLWTPSRTWRKQVEPRMRKRQEAFATLRAEMAAHHIPDEASELITSLIDDGYAEMALAVLQHHLDQNRLFGGDDA